MMKESEAVAISDVFLENILLLFFPPGFLGGCYNPFTTQFTLYMCPYEQNYTK